MSKATSILIAVLAGLVLFVAGYFIGKSNEQTANQAEQGKALEVAVEKHDQAAAAGQVVEQQSEARAAKTEAAFNTIQKGVVTYAQKHLAGPGSQCGLDPDGLRLWRAANDGADAGTAGGEDGALPAAAAAGEWKPDGSAGEPRRGGEGVSPVPGSAPGVDRLVEGH